MRFNGKELAALALQPSHKFDKEGILVVREKQDGLFRRGEVSAERWCRLRGNMLFYFKSRDQYSEPAGVIILEQCTVHLDLNNEDGPYPFSIVFDCDGGVVQFCAPTEPERDAWIQAVHMASYEYMRMQLKALHAKLDEKMVKTMIDENPTESGRTKNPTDLNDEPYLEMSLACDNLMCDGDGQPPNPIVLVSLMMPNQTQWSLCAQTEVFQRSSNPYFLTTVNLRLCDLRAPTTKIKLVVYDVRERLTSTMTFLGSAVFTARSLLTSEKISFRLSLMCGDGNPVGFISITAWQVMPDNSLDSSSETGRTKVVHEKLVEQQPPLLTGSLSLKSRSSHCGHLNLLFDNIISQTYRFHTGLGADLSVHEVMGESKFGFTLPQKIIQLFIKEEKDLLHTLTSMGNLKEEWNKRQAELLERHLHLINLYTLALHHMDSYAGTNFKPSSIKNCQNLEFVPVNLHVQRIWVHNDSVKKSASYDVITVGAFTAHARRFRHGGLSRLLNQVRLHSELRSDKLVNIVEAVAKIKQLKVCLEELVEQLVKHAFNSNASEMCSTMTDISTKSHHLIGVCDASLIDDACGILEEMRGSVLLGHDLPSLSEIAEHNKSPIHQIKQMKERSKSLDGTHLSIYKPKEIENCDSLFKLERISFEPKTIIDTNNRLLNSKKLDHRKETGSPRSLRRRGARMTRHGSLKDDKLKSGAGAFALRSPIVFDNKTDGSVKQESATVDFRTEIKLHNDVDSATSNLVLVNNAKNEEIDSIKPLDNEKSTKVHNDAVRNKSPDEPEPWDLTQLNIEASVMCMASKVKSLCRCSSNESNAQTSSLPVLTKLNWVDELMPSIRKLNQALDCLLKTANLAHIIYLLMEPLQAAAQQGCIQHRRDVVFVQSLTSIIVGLMTKLWCQRIDSCFLTRLYKVGILAEFEGLLSCHGDEMGMLEDMIVAIDDVSKVAFKLVPATDDKFPSLPNVEGGRLWMTVYLPAPEIVFNLLPAECSKGFFFHVTPVFFNVGINEQASIAERKSIACMYTATPNPNRFGDMSLQDKINTDGLEKLRDFYSKYKQVPITAEKGRRPSVSEALTAMIPELLDMLSAHTQSKKGKNVEILHYASKICRLLGGLRFTSCKSAKDRTSMSVTLEQCTILREQFDLAEPEFLRALECMRCEGTRRENALKNAGVKKYAFNSLQLMALPKLYRPPAGTYGNVQT